MLRVLVYVVILTVVLFGVEIGMNIGSKVRYINNEGKLSDELCELVEIKKDHYRIKVCNTGQIIRIYPDRVKEATSDIENNSVIDDQFDPFDGLEEGHEVWIKSNSFNDSVICCTYAIINKHCNSYKSINVYNGKASKTMVYSMKDYDSLINKLEKRCYQQLEGNK